VTRAYTVDENLDLVTILTLLSLLIQRTEAGTKAVRLVGLSLSGLQSSENTNNKQLGLQLGDLF